MKIYLISVDRSIYSSYYRSAVVIAENEEQARNTNPGCHSDGIDIDSDFTHHWTKEVWVSSPNDVNVEYLGETHINERRVICFHYHRYSG